MGEDWERGIKSDENSNVFTDFATWNAINARKKYLNWFNNNKKASRYVINCDKVHTEI